MQIPLNWLEEIVELPKKTNELTDKLTMVGHMLDKTSLVDGETVLDLELRGNRADCYSIYGIAREVAAVFDSKIKELAVTKLQTGQGNVKLSIKTPLVKRVGMIEIKNVVIKKSPPWLSQKLKAYGMESVNNIVDLTNYVMIETGEPMHAFDLDKIGGRLEIRLARKGEKLTTFMGSSIALSDEDLVWAKEGNVLSVAGAVGEKYNSISESTKNILLEAANYDRGNIRRTVYRHKLFTDAGIRHEKELDPSMVEYAIGRFLYLLQKNGWGDFNPKFYDYYPKRVLPKIINLELNLIETLGGIKLEKRVALDILRRLNFKVILDRNGIFEIEVPTYRTDILLPEDVVEEVLRIYGYDKIPQKTLSLEIPESVTPNYINQENDLRNSALLAGFDESITNSFVKENLLKFNIHPQAFGTTPVSLVNPPSPDNKDLRITLFPNLFEQTKRAINERVEEVRLFEIGKVYLKTRTGLAEERKIAFSYFARGVGSFIKFKELILGFLKKSQLTEVEFVSDPLNLPLHETYIIMIGKKVCGFGGVTEGNVYYLELDLDNLLGEGGKYRVKLRPKYPPQIEDVTIALPDKTKVGEVISLIKKVDEQIAKVELKDVYRENYTLNIEYRSPDKTLTDAEVNILHQSILRLVKTKFGGTVKE